MKGSAGELSLLGWSLGMSVKIVLLIDIEAQPTVGGLTQASDPRLYKKAN